MGNFLLKNLDKNTKSIVDICFDDVVVLDVVTVVTKSYEKLIKFLKNQNIKKIKFKRLTVQNIDLKKFDN